MVCFALPAFSGRYHLSGPLIAQAFIIQWIFALTDFANASIATPASRSSVSAFLPWCRTAYRLDSQALQYPSQWAEETLDSFILFACTEGFRSIQLFTARWMTEALGILDGGS